MRARYLPARSIRDRKPTGPAAAVVRYAQYPYTIEPVEEAAAWVAEALATTLAADPLPTH